MVETISDQSNVLNHHVLGCPIYFFEPKFQYVDKLSKYKQIKRSVKLLGWIKVNAYTVWLIQKLELHYIRILKCKFISKNINTSVRIY